MVVREARARTQADMRCERTVKLVQGAQAVRTSRTSANPTRAVRAGAHLALVAETSAVTLVSGVIPAVRQARSVAVGANRLVMERGSVYPAVCLPSTAAPARPSVAPVVASPVSTARLSTQQRTWPRATKLGGFQQLPSISLASPSTSSACRQAWRRAPRLCAEAPRDGSRNRAVAPTTDVTS
jgi:hypothetical protein